MQPILIAHNVNNTHVMPHGVTCTVNPNDIMHGSCDTHMLASLVSLCNYDVPQFTY